MSQPTDVRKLLEGMRDQLERDEREGRLAGLTVEDLSDAIAHPQAAESIAEVMKIEESSVQEGDPAPDFAIPWLESQVESQVESQMGAGRDAASLAHRNCSGEIQATSRSGSPRNRAPRAAKRWGLSET